MSMPDESRRIRVRIWSQFIVGVLILACLAAPSLIHSAAAVGTLRNLPAQWLPETSKVKTDFLKFVDTFALTDVIMVSWPQCKLSDPSVVRAVEFLEPLSLEDNSIEGLLDSVESDVEVAEDETPERVARKKLRDLVGVPRPLNWVRSGDDLLSSLTAAPVSVPEPYALRRLQGAVVGEDLTQTCIVISLGIESSPYHRDMLPMIRNAIADTVGCEWQEVAMVGGPVDGAEVDSESIRSIERFSPWVSLVAALLCLLCLRSFFLSVFVVAVAMVGQGMVLAMVYYSGHQMNAILIVLPPLVFVLTISSGIHLSNYFLDLIRHSDTSEDKTLLVRKAMQIGRMPCMVATGTTIVGLSSLLLVRLIPVHLFGIVASLGIAGTLGLLFLILPGAMLLTSTSKSKPSNPVETPTDSQRSFLALVVRVPWLVIGVCMAVCLLAAVGLERLTTSVSVPAMFQTDSDLRKQYRWFENAVGATMSSDLLVTFDESEGTPIDQLAVVGRMHVAISKIDGVGSVMSGATFLPPIPKGRGFAVVTRRSVITKLIQDTNSPFGQLGYVRENSEGQRVWRITVRLFQSEDTNFGDILDAITEQANELARSMSDQQTEDQIAAMPSDIAMTGHANVVQRTQEILLEDLFKSFLTAFVIILIVMSIVLRSPVGGLLSMIPNSMPTLVLFGVMGWTGTSLDIGSVMTASVALGIAVDDTVHLLRRFRAHAGSNEPNSRASLRALQQCGPAMFQTTFVCSVSLLVYGLSDFLPTQRFALFMFALLSIALLSVSLLLSAMMATWLGGYLGATKKNSA